MIRWWCYRLPYFALLFLPVSCSTLPGEISPPYKPRIEALVKQLTEEPYSIHIVEDHYTIASIDLRTQWITFNAKLAKKLIEKKPNWLRAILAHEIAHVELGHLYAGVASDAEKQELEFEADQEAVNILINRGHDPWDYWRWMKAVKKAADKNPRGFYEQEYSTRPYVGERLEKIEKMITSLSPAMPQKARGEEDRERKLAEEQGSSVKLATRRGVTVVERIGGGKIIGQHYIHDRKGYKITLPHEKWVPTSATVLDVRFRNDTNGGSIGTGAYTRLHGYFGDVSNWWVEAMSRKFDWTDVKILEERDLYLAGQSTKVVTLEYINRQGRKMIDRTYHILKPGGKYILYRLRMTSVKEKYEELLPTFEKLVKSFSFLWNGDKPVDSEPKAITIEDRFQKLKELRQKNLITKEEYQKTKKDLLKKLTQ